jgi:hypothetical protein
MNQLIKCIKCWWECGDVSTQGYGCWQCKLLWQTVWKFFKKLNTELPCEPEALLLDSYPNKFKTGTQMDTYQSVSIAVLGAVGKGGHKPNAHQQINW